MDFRENRLVFMTPPDAPDAPVATSGPEAPATPEASEPTATEQLIAGKKADLKGKVDAAQKVIDDLNAIYGRDEQGIDADTENNANVIQRHGTIGEALEQMITDFDDGTAELTENVETALTALETKLYEGVQAQLTDASADNLTDKAKAEMATTAKVTVEQADTALAQLETERGNDKEAKKKATKTVADSQDFIDGFKLAFPDKTADGLVGLLAVYKNNFDSNYKDKEDIDSTALTTGTTEFETAFKAKVAEVTGGTYEDAVAKIEAKRVKLEAEERGEEELRIPDYQRQVAEQLIGSKSARLEGAQVLGDRTAEYSISDATGCNLGVTLIEDGGEAVTVMDYSNYVTTHEYASLEDFKKSNPSITVPDGQNNFKTTEDIYLSESRPRPYKGVRRRRDFEVTLERDAEGKITKVKVVATNVRFGTEPNVTQQMGIRLGKPKSEINHPADILYPAGYTPSDSGDAHGEAVGAGVEEGETAEQKLARYKQELTEYDSSLKAMTQIEPGDPRLAELPKFLQDSITTATPSILLAHMKRAAELIKVEPVDMEALTAEMRVLEKHALQMKKKPGDDLSDLPEFQKFEKIKTRGLLYPPSRINTFNTHFADAGNHLENHFFDQGAMGDGEGNYVSLAFAKLSFYGSGVSKQVSGSFEIKVKGYEGEDSIKFKFNRMGSTDAGLTWESAVLNAIKKLTSDKDVNKQVKEHRNDRDKMMRTRRVIDEREASNASQRNRAQKRAPEKGKTFDPFSVPDYRGKEIDDVRKQIIEDHGDPAEYKFDTHGRHWAAVRVTPRDGVTRTSTGDIPVPSATEGGAEGAEADEEVPNAQSIIAGEILKRLNFKKLPSGDLMEIGVDLDEPNKLDINVGSRHMFLTITPDANDPNKLTYSFTDADSSANLHTFYDTYSPDTPSDVTRICALVQLSLGQSWRAEAVPPEPAPAPAEPPEPASASASPEPVAAEAAPALASAPVEFSDT